VSSVITKKSPSPGFHPTASPVGITRLSLHRSPLRQGRLALPPHPRKGGLDLLLEAGDQFSVGGDQGLLSFDLGDDGLLRGEVWEGDAEITEVPRPPQMFSMPMAAIMAGQLFPRRATTVNVGREGLRKSQDCLSAFRQRP
jgi:hypothetical protein